MAILINPCASVSPYLCHFGFRDLLLSNHLKITAEFIMASYFAGFVSAHSGRQWGGRSEDSNEDVEKVLRQLCGSSKTSI